MGDDGNRPWSMGEQALNSAIRDRNIQRADEAMRWMDGDQTFRNVLDYVTFLADLGDPRASRAAGRYVVHLGLALSTDLAELRRILELAEALPEQDAARELWDVAGDAAGALALKRQGQQLANRPPPPKPPKRSTGDWE